MRIKLNKFKVKKNNANLTIWHYPCINKIGVRSAMLDFQEIPNSLGNSSMLMEAGGHRMFFTIDNLPGVSEQ